MQRVRGWLKAHPWEAVSGVLGLGLLTSVMMLVTLSSTPGAPATPTTQARPGGGQVDPVPPTTQDGDAAPVGAAAGPFGESDPRAVAAVIVDNLAGVGPQIGLDKAPLLIEVPVEGGLTRFTALFGDSLPALVGPVRSLRPVSADLLSLFQPLVYTTGGKPFVIGAVEGAGVLIVTPDDLGFAFQALERPRPYHVFASPSEGPIHEVMAGSPWGYGEWAGGDEVAEVTVPIGSGVTWRFEDGVWALYRDQEPFQVLSDLDGAPLQLTRDTLILLFANEKQAGYTDSTGAVVPTFDVIGAGELYVFHNGEYVEGRWFRSDRSAAYVFSTTDGDPLLIPIGDAYLAVVPKGSQFVLGG